MVVDSQTAAKPALPRPVGTSAALQRAVQRFDIYGRLINGSALRSGVVFCGTGPMTARSLLIHR